MLDALSAAESEGYMRLSALLLDELCEELGRYGLAIWCRSGMLCLGDSCGSGAGNGQFDDITKKGEWNSTAISGTTIL